MQIPALLSLLHGPSLAAEQLQTWCLRDPVRGQQTLRELAEGGLTLDLLASLCRQLEHQLPALPNPDAALELLRRCLAAARSPLGLGALLDRDATALPMLLAISSLGTKWRELTIEDPAAFDRLRMSGGQPISREELVSEACAEVALLSEERSIVAALRRIKVRERLRIAYGEAVLHHNFELVAQQLAFLAEALLEGALQVARRKSAQRASAPRSGSSEASVALVALGRLGGGEMDYADELELLLVYDGPADSDATRRGQLEQMDRLARSLARLLADSDHGEALFRVRWIGLPDNSSSAIAHSAHDVVLGFDSFGRTWHRQAMIQARPVAGDRDLAAAVLRRLEPWIYRRYLSRADETGIKALRRRIIRRAVATGQCRLPLHERAFLRGAKDDDLADHATCDIEHSHGGLADLEGVVQFLQLLAGGEQALVRTGSVLAAVAGLEQARVLTVPERTQLEQSYVSLRQVAHRLQVQFSPQTSTLPQDEQHLAEIAYWLGGIAGGADFVRCCDSRLDHVWNTIARLLEAALPEEDLPAVVDLLLDPAPEKDKAAAALEGYGFRETAVAAANLQQLATERVPFLSTRNCRHFLSLIVERLLMAIGATPDPDATLANLCRVSDSLGGKGVLWELFHFHPASLLLYVRLCAASPYLSDILTTNPGMIDDLVDSLQLNKLPNLAELETQFAELSHSSTDPLPILHDLKNASHLRIGVLDILGQESIDDTHRALADVAEFCLARVVDREYTRLVEKFGPPTIGIGPFAGDLCRPVVLALGKLGGREPNYHSDIEVVFLYEAEGTTRPSRKSQVGKRTTNNHFFTQLAQRSLKELADLTPKGRLYNIDVILRPIGVGGALALPLADFAQHFIGGAAPLWQWQALVCARPVVGDATLRRAARDLVQQLLTTRPWHNEDRAEFYRARTQLDRGAAELNLKRGRGGTLDVEFLVQMLQLQHAAHTPLVLAPGTLPALAALAKAGHLDRDHAQYFAESYRLLRRIESALRLLNTSARHDLPDDPQQLGKLALLLNHPSPDGLRDRVIITLAENRRRWERLMGNV